MVKSKKPGKLQKPTKHKRLNQRQLTLAAISGVSARSTKWSQSVNTMEMSKPGHLTQWFGRLPFTMKSFVVFKVALWGACSPKKVYMLGPLVLASHYMQHLSLTHEVVSFRARCRYFWSTFNAKRTPRYGPQIGPDNERSYGCPYAPTFMNLPSCNSVSE
jgi:hypothetical protein